MDTRNGSTAGRDPSATISRDNSHADLSAPRESRNSIAGTIWAKVANEEEKSADGNVGESSNHVDFATVEDAISNIVDLHALQNDLLNLDDHVVEKSSADREANDQSKIAKITQLQRHTSQLFESRKEKDSHHARNKEHIEYIYNTVKPRVSQSVTTLKEGFIRRKYQHVLNQSPAQSVSGGDVSRFALGVDWNEVHETLQRAMKAAVALLQQGLGTSEKRMSSVIGKVMGYVKKLGKLESVIEKHPATAAMRRENLFRLQRRLVEIGLRAVALEVVDLVRMPLGMAMSKETQREKYKKLLKVLPDFINVIEKSTHSLQCELLRCDIGEKTDLPEWTRKHFHTHSDSSSQQLVSSCIENGFWPRILAKFNGLTSYDLIQPDQPDAEEGNARKLSKKPSFFEKQQTEFRQKRALEKVRNTWEWGDEASIYGLIPRDSSTNMLFVYTARRYWLLSSGLSTQSRSFLEAISRSRCAKALGLFTKAERRASDNVHRAVVEALAEEGITLGRNEANYHLAMTSSFVGNHRDFVNELQLRMLFDETKPALAETISEFYHRMMKGDDGTVDTPFSNVKLTDQEQQERRIILRNLRTQKAQVEKMFALMRIVNVAAKVKDWKSAENAETQLILADLLQWTNTDSIIRAHMPKTQLRCALPRWKYKYVGLQSLDEARYSLRSCPDSKFHSLLQKTDGNNSKWRTWLCREVSPEERYVPRELRRKMARGTPLSREEQKTVNDSMQQNHSCFEYLIMCIPLWLLAAWDNVWSTGKFLLGGWGTTDYRYFTKQHDTFKDPILGIVLNVLDENEDKIQGMNVPPTLEEMAGVAIKPLRSEQDFDDDQKLIAVSERQVGEVTEALTQYVVVPYDSMIVNRNHLLEKCMLLDPSVQIDGADFEDDSSRSRSISRSSGMTRQLDRETYFLRHAKSDELDLSVEKFQEFAQQVGKSKALQVEIESEGKQLVLPCRLKIIFKTLRNLDVETMNLDAELTILTWVGLDGLDKNNKEHARKLKLIRWHAGCHPQSTPIPKDPDGNDDLDFLGLPVGGLKFRVNEKEYRMADYSPNVVMPKANAEEQVVAITCRGTFSFNFFDRNSTLHELQNYPFDVTPIMLKYEMTSFQVTPPSTANTKPFKCRMNIYNIRTTHGRDGLVDSISKLVSYKSSADKVPEYDIDLSHTCVWFESENKLVERTGKYISYYPTMVVQIRLFRDPGFALLAMVLPLVILSFINVLILYVDGVNFFAEKVNNLSTQMLATFTYLLFVRTRLPPISRLTNIDKLIAGTIGMIIVVILQTCWEGAFYVKLRERGDLDDGTNFGDLDDEEYSELPLTECGKMNAFLRYLLCGQSHDWNQDGSNMDDYYQGVYKERQIGDTKRPFLLLVGGMWVSMLVMIIYKTQHFYRYQRPRYYLELERKQRINVKHTIENLCKGETKASQVFSEALFAKQRKGGKTMTDVKVVTSNYLGDASKYVLGGAHSLQFGYMTEGEFNSTRSDHAMPRLRL